MESAAQIGDNSRTAFLGFVREYIEVDEAVTQALGLRKNLRARIKGAGISLAVFDRARLEAEKSDDEREAADEEFRRLMDWLGKPVGFQATFLEDGPAEASSVSPAQRQQVEAAGAGAATAEQPRDSNPWSPGSELWAIWDAAWERNSTPPLRRRGRPPGSRNRPKGNSEDARADVSVSDLP